MKEADSVKSSDSGDSSCLYIAGKTAPQEAGESEATL